MKKKLYKGLLFAAMMALSGCAGGSKGQTVPDITFSELHETYLPEVALSGDFTVTYQCKVTHESGTLEDSELGFDLIFDEKTLHMPLLEADTYLELADGTIHEFTAEEKAKGRKEPGSVYSTNKVPSSGVELTIKLTKAGDVISGEGTYEGGAMGKGTHQFWIYHYYSDVKLPENLKLQMTGQNIAASEIRYHVE